MTADRPTPRAGDTYLPVEVIIRGAGRTPEPVHQPGDVVPSDELIATYQPWKAWHAELETRLRCPLVGAAISSPDGHLDAHLHMLVPFTAGDDADALIDAIHQETATVLDDAGCTYGDFWPYQIDVHPGETMVTWEELDWHLSLPVVHEPPPEFDWPGEGERP